MPSHAGKSRYTIMYWLVERRWVEDVNNEIANSPLVLAKMSRGCDPGILKRCNTYQVRSVDHSGVLLGTN